MQRIYSPGYLRAISIFKYGETMGEESMVALGHSLLDADREQRSGIEEVVFAEHKAADQLCEIVAALLARKGRVLLTRLRDEHRVALERAELPLAYYPAAHAASGGMNHPSLGLRLAVVTGGTSDHRVAEEAAITAEYFGLEVTRAYDVGVAGLPRLLDRVPELAQHDFIIAVAGMEGALPTVLAGLVAVPIVAVPTSVGYGVGLGGISALLSMLASCSPGVSVVNIDNGFGAAIVAVKSLRQLAKRPDRATIERS